jgi:hypothetical protein
VFFPWSVFTVKVQNAQLRHFSVDFGNATFPTAPRAAANFFFSFAMHISSTFLATLLCAALCTTSVRAWSWPWSAGITWKPVALSDGRKPIAGFPAILQFCFKSYAHPHFFPIMQKNDKFAA